MPRSIIAAQQSECQLCVLQRETSWASDRKLTVQNCRQQKKCIAIDMKLYEPVKVAGISAARCRVQCTPVPNR